MQNPDSKIGRILLKNDPTAENICFNKYISNSDLTQKNNSMADKTTPEGRETNRYEITTGGRATDAGHRNRGATSL